jgi:hypothetical protein
MTMGMRRIRTPRTRTSHRRLSSKLSKLSNSNSSSINKLKTLATDLYQARIVGLRGILPGVTGGRTTLGSMTCSVRCRAWSSRRLNRIHLRARSRKDLTTWV